MKTLQLGLLALMLMFAPSAYAGHTVNTGAYCGPCDNVTCICDRGEVPGGGLASADPRPDDQPDYVLLGFAGLAIGLLIVRITAR